MMITHKEWFRLVDKVTWSKGEWDKESDRVQWLDESSGYPCLIRRIRLIGSWCGYVGISESNKAHGMGCDDLDDLLEGNVCIEVHGGLTFAGFTYCTKINHEGVYVEENGEPKKFWWFGFDCAHAWDIMPAFDATLRGIGHGLVCFAEDVYRNQEYVVAETSSLAEQLMQFERA